jgi:tetratricopeptide (TPR) repeat protein
LAPKLKLHPARGLHCPAVLTIIGALDAAKQEVLVSKKAPKKPPETSMPAFDPRAMEKMLADVGRVLSEREFASAEEANAYLNDMLASGQPMTAAPRTPLEEAQDLMYEAWEAKGKRRLELARKALKISPDCADCYVLLAEEGTRSLEEARDLYEQGVKAGERAVGPEAFKENAGHFWGIMETRPYMRARAGLAQVLWLLGERRPAIEHLQDMLRLNPDDNQGLRFVLMGWLLGVGDDRALGELLHRYHDDGGAEYLYTNALWLFRSEGAKRKANHALQKAMDENSFVPLYLLGRRKLPTKLPEYIGFGDESEAVAYAGGAIAAWRETEGALTWLAEQIGYRRQSEMG